MANVYLTYKCNLRCPYCFANEFVNKDSSNLSFEKFIEIVNFILKEGPSRLGLIGGEPLIHPQFSKISSFLRNNIKVRGINLYTNGIYINKWLDDLIDKKFDILINCNPPSKIGKESYKVLKQNLDLLFRKKKDGISLGMNIYDEEIDYNYIFELLEIIEGKGLRISLSVPDFSIKTYNHGLEYFREKKNLLWKILLNLKDNNIIPYYDCNIVPSCIWDEEQLNILKSWKNENPNSYTNIISGISTCEPIIDILPNLQVVRCFGLSDVTKVRINDFKSLSEINNYYLKKDKELQKLKVSKLNHQCQNCKDKSICKMGCLGFYKQLINEESESRERE